MTSADPAHSLGDSMGLELGSAPTEVRPGCGAQQLDARERLEDSWAEIREWLLSVLDWAGVGSIEAEELAVIPGLDELFALTELETLVASGRYDVIVVDCAPTAETIRLLSLPDDPQLVHGAPVPGVATHESDGGPGAAPVDLAAGGRRRRVLRRAAVLRPAGRGSHASSSDPSVTSVRLVVNPERMVIAEARRTFTYLSLFGYQVDAVVVNRVLPGVGVGSVVAGVATAAEAAPAHHRGELRPAATFVAEHVGGEVVGLDAVEAFGGDCGPGPTPRDG